MGCWTGRSDVRQILPCFMLLKCWGLVLSLVALKWCLRLMSMDSTGQDNGSHRFSGWWSPLKQPLKALWVPFMIGYIFHWSSIDSFTEYFFELSACLLYDVTITDKTVAPNLRKLECRFGIQESWPSFFCPVGSHRAITPNRLFSYSTSARKIIKFSG